MNEIKHIQQLVESLSHLEEGRYWDNEGQYEKQAVELQGLVPGSGAAKTLRAEIFRAAMKIYYDYYNNGFGNVWLAPAQFLMNHIDFSPRVLQMLVDHAIGNMGSNLDTVLEEMMSAVIEQIYEMDDQPTGDMWDTSYSENDFTPDQYDDDDDSEDDDEYDDDEDYR